MSATKIRESQRTCAVHNFAKQGVSEEEGEGGWPSQGFARAYFLTILGGEMGRKRSGTAIMVGILCGKRRLLARVLD